MARCCGTAPVDAGAALTLIAAGCGGLAGVISGYTRLRTRFDSYAARRLADDLAQARAELENRRFVLELSAPPGPAGAHPVPVVDLGPLPSPPPMPATYDEALEQYVALLGARDPDPTFPLRVWLQREWDGSWLTRHVLEHHRQQAAIEEHERRHAAADG